MKKQNKKGKKEVVQTTKIIAETRLEGVWVGKVLFWLMSVLLFLLCTWGIVAVTQKILNLVL